MRYLLDTFFKKPSNFFSKVFFEDIFQAKNQKFYKKINILELRAP